MIDIRNGKVKIAYTYELVSARAIQCPARDPQTNEWLVSQGDTSTGGAEDTRITLCAKADGNGFCKRISEMKLIDGGHGTTISVLYRNGVRGVVVNWNLTGPRWLPYKPGTFKVSDSIAIFREVASGNTNAYIDHERSTVATRKGATFKLFELKGDKAGKQIGKTLTGIDEHGPGQGFFTLFADNEYTLFAGFGYGHAEDKPSIHVASFETGKSYVMSARVLPAKYELQEPESGFGLEGIPYLGMSSKKRGGDKTPIAVQLIEKPAVPGDNNPPVAPIEIKEHFPADAFYNEMLLLEGKTNWMYFDTVNLATVGVGNMIDTGSKLTAEGAGLNWRVGSKTSKTMATPTKITAEYKRLKALNITAQGGMAYEKHAKLFISDGSVRTLFDRKTKQFRETITGYIPNFDQLRADAQLAAMSMAWNVGPNMFNPESDAYWPNLSAALKEEDYWRAVDNCEINGRPSVRNRHNRILFMNAQWNKQFSKDPNRFYGTNITVDVSTLAAADPEKLSGPGFWVQGMLRELGHYTAIVDGLFGPMSKEALITYGQTQGLSGKVDLATLKELSKDTLQVAVVA